MKMSIPIKNRTGRGPVMTKRHCTVCGWKGTLVSAMRYCPLCYSNIIDPSRPTGRVTCRKCNSDFCKSADRKCPNCGHTSREYIYRLKSDRDATIDTLPVNGDVARGWFTKDMNSKKVTINKPTPLSLPAWCCSASDKKQK